MKSIALIFVLSSSPIWASVESFLTPFSTRLAGQMELKNDSFNETGSPVYLQLGFVKSEKAGVWVKVPETVKQFHVDYFRVLIGGARQVDGPVTVFFQMGYADQLSPYIPAQIENAASLTAGPYWNDIPAQGSSESLGCVKGGSYVGAAIEFTHDGAPSVYRDHDGVSNALANTLFAVGSGWNYSVAFGLQGDWVLRVVGHEATDAECRIE